MINLHDLKVLQSCMCSLRERLSLINCSLRGLRHTLCSPSSSIQSHLSALSFSLPPPSLSPSSSPFPSSSSSYVCVHEGRAESRGTKRAHGPAPHRMRLNGILTHITHTAHASPRTGYTHIHTAVQSK